MKRKQSCVKGNLINVADNNEPELRAAERNKKENKNKLVGTKVIVVTLCSKSC